MAQYGPMEGAANLPAPAVTGDQNDYPNMPGHQSPMHPGCNEKPRFTSRTSGKHKGFRREYAPTYSGSRGGAAPESDGD